MNARTSPTTKIVDDHDAVHRINVSWLIRLRWAAIVGQAVVIAYVEWGLRIALPLGPLSAILAVELAGNVVFEIWLRRRLPVSEPVVAVAMALDVSCFTGLLYLTGGPLNPFSFLYLVHVALAALVLRQRWAWTLVLFSVGASAALFVRHIPLPMDHGMGAGMHQHMMHHGAGEPLDLHLRGMWVAFAVAAAFIVYFINRVTRALADREAELGRAKENTARTEKLASIATLAAGAAHELATPLSTIAVIAKELERAATPESVAADARLVRAEVERCRSILAQMAEGAGEAPGEIARETSAEELVRVAVGGLTSPERVRVEWAEGARGESIFVPVFATAQALRNVLSNGIDASPGDDADVVFRIARFHAEWRFEIIDSGGGMSTEVLAHATEPFFTTKEPGRGMGLGLFLTRSVVERLGGGIDLDSRIGRGTRVMVTLPGGAATNGRIASGERP